MANNMLLATRDKQKIEKLVLSSRNSSYSMLGSNIAFLYRPERECSAILPGREKNVFNLKVLYSFGRSVDGGPFTIGENCPEDAAFKLSVNTLKYYDLVILTLRPWTSLHGSLLKMLKRETPGDSYLSYSYIYPRIVPLNMSFREYLSRISKKARNRYRYFLKIGGLIRETDPTSYILDIAEVNLSSPYRQGRRLPKTYLDPELIMRSVKAWSLNRRRGIASFYAAILDGKLIGYSYVPHLNGHAYASSFLVHSKYLSTGAANALLTIIYKDLKERNKAYLFQYGYWRQANPGINNFLKKQLFSPVKEPVVVMSRKTQAVLSFLYSKWISLSNTLPKKGPYVFASILYNSIKSN